MQILFLGTGAGDFRSLDDDDSANEHILRCRELGGRNLRHASQALLEPGMLIDFYSDEQLVQLQVALSDIRHLLITHCHWDHFQPHRILEFARQLPHPLEVYGNATAEAGLEFAATNTWDADRKRFCPRDEPDNLIFHLIGPGQSVAIDDATVTAVLANHRVDSDRRVIEERALNYVIERDGKTLFYGLDSSYTLPATLDFLRAYRFDMAVFDATFGHLEIDPAGSGHHNFAMLNETIAEFRGAGIVTDDTAFFGSHISLGYVPPHDDIADETARAGLTLAFDGLKVEV